MSEHNDITGTVAGIRSNQYRLMLSRLFDRFEELLVLGRILANSVLIGRGVQTFRSSETTTSPSSTRIEFSARSSSDCIIERDAPAPRIFDA
jgi:hypothetical protein